MQHCSNLYGDEWLDPVVIFLSFIFQIFHVVSLQAMYTEKKPKLVSGILAPTQNVATVEMSAYVIKGVSRSRNALLNGDFKSYDWDSGYTCHQLGSGDIVIQLGKFLFYPLILFSTPDDNVHFYSGQPYYIGSMRLLLWDCDERTYSFYIETSTNRVNWNMAVDKTNEQLRSWQSFEFNPRPVVFIKIVGTFNTANEVGLAFL